MSLKEYVKVLDSDPATSPACSHGPALLFDRVGKQFFACSACRDRKLCPLYVEVGAKRSFKSWSQIRERHIPQEPHEDPAEVGDESLFCEQCCRIWPDLQSACCHSDLRHVQDSDAKSPSTFLAQLSANKGHAQYHFDTETLSFIVRLASRFDKVLCLGTPSVFECLRNSGVKCHLADIDRRLETFFGPTEFTWFNMLNGLAFRDGSDSCLWKFASQSGDSLQNQIPDPEPNVEKLHSEGTDDELIRTKDLNDDRLGSALVLVDPPFGGLLGPLAKTLRELTQNGVWATALIFPYFNEAQVKLHLPSLNMCDLAVRYRNQRKMKDDSSPVRIFTDVPLDRIALPEPTYKFCDQCNRWMHSVNVHCEVCCICPSKNHAPTKHCSMCQRCVKQTWAHCAKCERCHLAGACGARRGAEREPLLEEAPPPKSMKLSIHRRKKRK